MKQISEMSLPELVQKASQMSNAGPPTPINFESTTSNLTMLAVIAALAVGGYYLLKGVGGFNPFANWFKWPSLPNMSIADVPISKWLVSPLSASSQAGTVANAKISMSLMNTISGTQDQLVANAGKSNLPQAPPALVNFYKQQGWVTAPKYSVTDPNAYAAWNAASGGSPSWNQYGLNLGTSLAQSIQVAAARNPAGFFPILGAGGVLLNSGNIAYDTAVLQKENAQLNDLNNQQVTSAEKAMGWASPPQYKIYDPNAYLKWLGI